MTIEAMKLSGLIRQGAAMRPQTQDVFFDGRGSCAWGAAIEAAHGTAYLEALAGDFTPLAATIDIAFPDYHKTRRVQHPEQPYKDALFLTIAELNDRFYWTRERIADWLESEGL